MKKFIFLLITILFLAGCGVSNQSLVNGHQLTTNKDSGLVNVKTVVPVNTIPKAVNVNTNTVPKQPELPAVFDLKVAFASQAPFANWDYLHNEACEEASMIMAVKYFKGEALDKQIMEDEIQKISKWEGENGYAVDLTAAEVVKVLADYFGMKTVLSWEVTADKIKQELVSGNLIIVPLAGRDIGNPYYRQPGPLYHMLLIRGYDELNFITNDPGTKHGEAYRYTYGDLLWAVHDWQGGVRPADESQIDMKKGKKVMVVVSK
jgi:hypothetical protein